VSPSFHVRRIAEDDWLELRSLRLRALADCPDAFGSTLAEESAYREDDWRAWTRTAAVFIAYRHGEPVGLAAGVEGDDPRERRLVAAWVDPSHRRAGAASALLGAVERWARDRRATALSLWVTRSNQPARTLYLRRGFLPSGRTKALPGRPALVEEQLVLRLT
jgi:GNAT superfamily N-acetyltransferase